MKQEIERKFLVKDKSYLTQIDKSTHILQGYLSTDPERLVRIRVEGKKGYIIIKGKATNKGIVRPEFIQKIDKNDALDLLQLCKGNIIQKIRHKIWFNSFHTFYIDEFLGKNNGLVIAEIELDSVKTKVPQPSWLGDEVTGKPEYYNENLI